MDIPRLANALDAVNRTSDKVTTSLDWLLTSALAGPVEHCYLPEGVNLIRAAAAATPSEAMAAQAKLKAKFGKDFNIPRFRTCVREAKESLTVPTETDNDPPAILRDGNGKILAGLENANIYFSSSPDWSGVIALNEFTGGIELRRPAPSPVSQPPGSEIEDVFDTHATRWLERRAHMLFKPEIVHRVVNDLATQNRFHPVREHLQLLPAWDGVERISNWLFAYCGVDPGSDTKPNHFAANVGRRFLISMIARPMCPRPTQVDHVLVLEGKTGIGKSSLAKLLCGNMEWFTDQMPEMGTKDASMAVRGSWIVEFADLDGLNKVDERTAKKFISQQFDRFRLPYGKRVARFNRQCVFIGTTERSDWMKSETGRRWWPVLCRRIDLDAFAAARDQLLAEALHCYAQGERWHLAGADEVAEATSEQRKRFADDVWRERVLEIMAGLESESPYDNDWVPTQRVIDKMNIPMSQQNNFTIGRVGSILRMEGFIRKQIRVSGTQTWGHYRETPE